MKFRVVQFAIAFFQLVLLHQAAAASNSLGHPKVCEHLFAVHSETKSASLLHLERAVIYEAEDAKSESQHQIIYENGKVIFDVDYLSAKFPETLKALGKAISEGQLNELDLGLVMGPKMFKWLHRTIRQIPPGHQMIIKGTFSMPTIMRARARLAAKWSQQDQNEFEAALQAIDMPAAGKSIYGTDQPENWKGMTLYYDPTAQPAATWTYYELIYLSDL